MKRQQAQGTVVNNFKKPRNTQKPATDPDFDSSQEPSDPDLEPTSLRENCCKEFLKDKPLAADAITIVKTRENLDASLKFQLSLLRLTQQATLRGSVKPGKTDPASELAQLTSKVRTA